MKRTEQEFIDSISEEIEIPDVVQCKAQDAFQQIRGEKSMKHKKKFNRKKAIISAASIAVIATVIAAGNVNGKVYAGIKAISYDIANTLGIDKDLEPYTTVVNQSVTDKDVTITLNEVILDGDELIVSTTESYVDELPENYFSKYSGSVFINGRLASYAASGGSELIGEHNIGSVISYSLDDKALEGDLDIELVFYDTEKSSFFQTSGLRFAFSTSGEELAANTVEIPLDQRFVLEDGTELTAYRYSRNPVSEIIRLTCNNSCNYDLKLKGEDNLGNPVEFNLSEIHDGNIKMELSNIENGNISNDAASLTLRLYAVEFPKESGKLSNDFKPVGEKFTIDLR